MNPDQPPKPPNEWAELEKDPKFQLHFRLELINELLRKKFGESFLKEYEDLTADQIKEKGVEDTLPIIPEVDEFEKKVRGVKSIEEMLALAKKEGLEFTQEELDTVKVYVLEFIANEEGK